MRTATQSPPNPVDGPAACLWRSPTGHQGTRPHGRRPPPPTTSSTQGINQNALICRCAARPFAPRAGGGVLDVVWARCRRGRLITVAGGGGLVFVGVFRRGVDGAGAGDPPKPGAG